ncbi:helix-turn-helix transcriptional regulator [Metabacillus sp. GX 13764]|uniref:helix-turn-helix domain-containing protein n=1 Tax=Metabacillus kandeliae TaxID=2900151 RepID=UPI001E37D60E|nr:helix-turn-helix transcriptional regulator [Metabacillus kandeliae]MCD7035855.1 helix-turn-helix transcriptional regulator [Metabacillus kandeliae]
MIKIKELRKQNGDTLKQLAQKINYDYSNLSKIERGIYKPSLELLSKIAQVYSKDLNYFADYQADYTAEERKFIAELELTAEDLTEKYNLALDGKKLTKDELEFIVLLTRNLRKAVDSK